MSNVEERYIRADGYAKDTEAAVSLLVAQFQKLRWLGFDDEAERLIIRLHSDARCAALACVPDTD